MLERMIKDTDYINMQGWMSTKLHLKRSRIQVYAIIHGFSKDGRGVFKGGNNYLMKWTGASKRTIINDLNELVSLGLISKSSYTNEFGNYEYKVTEKRAIVKKSGGAKIALGTKTGVQNLHGGGAKFALEGVQNLHKGGAKFATSNKTSNKTNSKTREKDAHTHEDEIIVNVNCESETILKSEISKTKKVAAKKENAKFNIQPIENGREKLNEFLQVAAARWNGKEIGNIARERTAQIINYYSKDGEFEMLLHDTRYTKSAEKLLEAVEKCANHYTTIQRYRDTDMARDFKKWLINDMAGFGQVVSFQKNRNARQANNNDGRKATILDQSKYGQGNSTAFG